MRRKGLTYSWKEENRDNNWNERKLVLKRISIGLSGTQGLWKIRKGLDTSFFIMRRQTPYQFSEPKQRIALYETFLKLSVYSI